MSRNIAIIPARSGSKGLPHKNIKMLQGKPLMSYSIEAARESNIFDCIHVSTDSEEYANIAKAYGADSPFLRAKELSTDRASSWDVVMDVLDKYEKLGEKYDVVTLLQPTSPLRTAEDIQKAFELFCKEQVKAVVSVCEMEHSPLWSNTLPDDGSMESFLRDEGIGIRQTLDTYYRINGAIYMIDCSFLRDSTKIYRKGCYAYKMDRKRSIDIDTQLDFDLAEFMLNREKSW